VVTTKVVGIAEANGETAGSLSLQISGELAHNRLIANRFTSFTPMPAILIFQ
jgi:hypothetical protein